LPSEDAWILAIPPFLAQLLRVLQRVSSTDENDFHISQYSAIGYRSRSEPGVHSKCRGLGENMTPGEQHDRHHASAHCGIGRNHQSARIRAADRTFFLCGMVSPVVIAIIWSAMISSSSGAVPDAGAMIRAAMSILALCFLVITLFARMHLRDSSVGERARP